MAQEAMTASDRVLEIFDTKSTVTGGTRTITNPQGDLRFNNVSFHFPVERGTGQSPVERGTGQSPVEGGTGQSPVDTDRPGGVPEPVLRGVDLHVLPGETVAIVGATGSGKTALTGLVPRLYDVTGGSITIDGVDIRELTLDSLRTIVATAFEDPTLFSMSARENITLGRPDASDDDVAAAVETAQASFVYELPWGLDTRIGEQGMSLSGGQRQRLALARAVLAKPRILVLDDTLSALDVHTEALVEKALRLVLRDATGIVVAHRASTVMLADKVALLQNGTITHVGVHHDLLATVPAYRDLLGGDEVGDERVSTRGVVVS
jgi:ATP-binding cassette subfamily B protein